jgi:phospholipid-translocating ATPase
VSVFSGLQMNGYVTLYNNLALFLLMIDEDICEDAALEYSPLYKTLQKGRSLNLKTFFIWLWMAIFQGGVIIFGAIIFFPDSFANMTTITFSALVLIELLNIHMVLRLLTWKMIAVQYATILSYMLSMAFFSQETSL